MRLKAEKAAKAERAKKYSPEEIEARRLEVAQRVEGALKGREGIDEDKRPLMPGG